MKTIVTPQPTMKIIKPSNPPRRFSSRWPYEDLTTPADHEIEGRIQTLRESVGDDAQIEVHRIDHQPTCGLHDGHPCDCIPVPVCIIDGREWLRLLADGTVEPATPPEPHPDWLDCPEEPHLLAEVMPIAEWLRVQVCRHVISTIGEGSSARFIGGDVIDSPLTRTIRRIEGPQPLLLP